MNVMMADKLTPIGLPIIRGINKKNHRITITNGMERMVLTYIVAGITSHGLPDKRISANTVPTIIPPTVAITVS
jgi:hypothetical protein